MQSQQQPAAAGCGLVCVRLFDGTTSRELDCLFVKFLQHGLTDPFTLEQLINKMKMEFPSEMREFERKVLYMHQASSSRSQAWRRRLRTVQGTTRAVRCSAARWPQRERALSPIARRRLG